MLNTYRQNGEHHLGDVERVTPVMVSNMSIIFLHAQQPSAQHFVVDVKALHEIQLQEHSQAGLPSAGKREREKEREREKKQLINEERHKSRGMCGCAGANRSHRIFH